MGKHKLSYTGSKIQSLLDTVNDAIAGNKWLSIDGSNSMKQNLVIGKENPTIKLFDQNGKLTTTLLGSSDHRTIISSYPSDQQDYTERYYFPIPSSGLKKDEIYNILTSKNVKDYIIEQGDSGVWTYMRFADGTAMCWCKRVIGPTTTGIADWGTTDCPWYYHGAWTLPNYPFTFDDIPLCFVNRIDGYEGFINTMAQGTTTTPPTVCLVRPDIAEDISYTVSVLAIGKCNK